MSKNTKIQWCDSTINPVMGCGGCELFPPPTEVVGSINAALADIGIKLDSRHLLKSLITDAHSKIGDPGKSPKRQIDYHEHLPLPGSPGRGRHGLTW